MRYCLIHGMTAMHRPDGTLIVGAYTNEMLLTQVRVCPHWQEQAHKPYELSADNSDKIADLEEQVVAAKKLASTYRMIADLNAKASEPSRTETELRREIAVLKWAMTGEAAMLLHREVGRRDPDVGTVVCRATGMPAEQYTAHDLSGAPLNEWRCAACKYDTADIPYADRGREAPLFKHFTWRTA